MTDIREITLLELLIIIWRKLKKCLCEIFRFIKLTVCLSVKYFWVLMASMVVFFALGYVATLPILTKYRVEGVATFFTENRLALENEIRVLNSLKETNSDLFNKKFNITQQQNKYLKEIRLLPVIDFLNDSVPDVIAMENNAYIMSDTVNRVVPYMVSVCFIFRGNMDYKPYMEGLVSYLDHVESLRKTDSIAKATTMSKIAFYDKEIERLERLSEYDYFQADKGGLSLDYSKKQGITIESSSKRLYYEDIKKLIKERDFLSNYASNKDHVINFMSPDMMVYSFSRIKLLAIFLIVGLAVGIVLAHCIYRRRRWR